ncbi:TPA: hypothetical protein ACPJ1W_004678 [Vibrio alginolyticus]
MFSAEQNRNIVLWQCFTLYSSCSYLSCIGYRLSVIGYRLSVIGYRLSVIGYRLSVLSQGGANSSIASLGVSDKVLV